MTKGKVLKIVTLIFNMMVFFVFLLVFINVVPIKINRNMKKKINPVTAKER